ncbi:hypothetical protein [Variovorax sp. Sphag1AA]|uniref:hypothetical protein n=1 Tax=Variovorax sp. Sphag1AA TaxID=2587027 RepID=UPI00160F799C|nr:hypothetical protein [Variovorax sp. Sphag1AA]MBB3180815.1 hypothetical protein [Variovorax sp. Sphag1AA]
MAHPTCASAHPTNDSTARVTALAARLASEADDVREAYHAITCITKMVVHARAAPASEQLPKTSITEREAMLSFLSGELDRRVKNAKFTAGELTEMGAYIPQR